MFSEKTSLTLTLVSCLMAGTAMAMLRALSAPLWLILILTLFWILFLLRCSKVFQWQNGKHASDAADTSLAESRRPALLFAAFFFLCSAIIQFPAFLSDGMILSFLLVAGTLLSAVSCALRYFRGETDRNSALFAMLPVFFFCIQTLAFYRSNSNHPDLSSFGYEIPVLCLLLFGLFYTASGKYRNCSAASQRFWAMLPLSGVWMELFLLLFASRLILRAADMTFGLLFCVLGGCAMLLLPLRSPVIRVVFPPEPIPDEDAPAEEESVPEPDSDLN